MTIHITITTDDKSEANGAFQLVSFLNQLDITGTGDGIVWTEQKPMSITVDWSGRVETIKDHVE
mgnify:FL=1|jgi:hypothetical protein